jgi:hypothetical protein
VAVLAPEGGKEALVHGAASDAFQRDAFRAMNFWIAFAREMG